MDNRRNHKNNKGRCVLELFSVLRKCVLEAYDAQSVRMTRTQQMILCAMSGGETLSMTELAKIISTSNEQATRAVSQLVEAGYIERSQNRINHRIVNIRLTDKAMGMLDEVSGHISDELSAGSVPGDGNKQIEELVSELMKQISE